MLSRFAKLTTMFATFALAAFVLFPAVSAGQGKDRLERGRKLYVQYCASCHGMDAKGSGPVAAELKTAPSNLTTIAQRHNGKFDAIHVQNNINGEKDVQAHGTKDMPVWAAYFRSTKGQSIATLNIYALTEYLEAVQVK
jgi:mono/diheme cytochrome c family protein